MAKSNEAYGNFMNLYVNNKWLDERGMVRYWFMIEKCVATVARDHFTAPLITRVDTDIARVDNLVSKTSSNSCFVCSDISIISRVGR